MFSVECCDGRMKNYCALSLSVMKKNKKQQLAWRITRHVFNQSITNGRSTLFKVRMNPSVVQRFRFIYFSPEVKARSHCDDNDIFYKYFSMPLPSQCEHSNWSPCYPFLPLPLPSWMGTDHSWRQWRRHKKLIYFVVAVTVWTNLYLKARKTQTLLEDLNNFDKVWRSGHMDLYGEITFTMCQFVFKVSQIWIVSWSHLVAECYFKALLSN